MPQKTQRRHQASHYNTVRSSSRETAGSWLFVHLPEHQHAQHKTLQALHLALPGLQQSSSIFRSEVRCCLKVEEQAKMLS